MSCSDDERIIDIPKPIEPLRPDLDEKPSWSPDGAFVLYHHKGITQINSDLTYEIDPAMSGLWIVDTLGVHTNQLVRGLGAHGEINNSGEAIVFSTGQLFLAAFASSSIDSSTITQLTFSGSNYNPSWSPGDSLIAWDSNRGGAGYHIWVMDLVNALDTMVPTPGRTPDWFPDGEQIAFSGYPMGSTSREIVSFDLLSDTLERLTENDITDINPSVSSDGARVLFERKGEIWIMNSDGSGKRKVMQGSNPSWAPDGRRIAFVNRPEGRPQDWGTIWIFDDYSKTSMQITSGLLASQD